MASNNYYIKINSKNQDGTVSIDVCKCSDTTASLTIQSNHANRLTENLYEIQIGIDRNGINTTDSDIIEQMAMRGEDVALAGYYLTPEGSVYRRMTPHRSWNREKEAIIREFKELQTRLMRLIDNGYKAFVDRDDCEICDCIYKCLNKKYRDEEIAAGRMPCVGEDYGCMETTNGSQYCCRTYCPSEVENIE